MITKKKVKNSQEQYQEWLKYNPIKKLSFQEQEYLDSEIQQKIIKELKITSDLGIREFMLKHKWQEIKEFVKTHDKDTIQEVYDLMWRPVGRSDFRRIVPELILISEKFFNVNPDIVMIVNALQKKNLIGCVMSFILQE